MITASLQMTATPERRGEILARRGARMESGRPGCRILQDLDDEDVLVLVEEWTSREASRLSDEYRQLLTLVELSARPPVIRFDTVARSEWLELVMMTTTTLLWEDRVSDPAVSSKRRQPVNDLRRHEMLTVDTLAEIDEDGTLTAKTPAYGTKGRRRVVIVIDEAEGNRSTVPRRLPDLSDFRARLNCKPYPGNSVVDLRDEER